VVAVSSKSVIWTYSERIVARPFRIA